MFDDGERGERGGSQTLAPIWSYQGSFISLEETARFDRESDRMPPYSRFSSFHSVGSRVLARPWDQAGRRRTGSVCSQKRRYIVEEFTLATMRNDWREQRTFSASIDRLPQCEGPRGNAHLSVWPLHSTPLLVSSPSPLLGCLRGRLFIYPSSCPDCLNLTAIGNHGVRKGRA